MIFLRIEIISTGIFMFIDLGKFCGKFIGDKVFNPGK
jgi:hypothetical protein